MTEDERGELAAAMVPRACHLACLVHDADQEAVASFLAAIQPHEVDALLVVLAGMVPVVDRSPGELLAWTGSVPEAVKWRQLPLLMPAREPEPCPSPQAYRRHKSRGEDTEACGCGKAARAEWRARQRAAASARTPAARAAARGKTKTAA